MKAIYLILLMCFFCNNSFTQLISIQTSYYGYMFTLKELYISYDSRVVEGMEKHLLNRDDKSSIWYIPPERRNFVLVSEETFTLLLRFIKENEKPVSRYDYPKPSKGADYPFKTIYYIDISDSEQSKEEREKEREYVNNNFGKDIAACKEYFQRMLEVIPDTDENTEIRTLLGEMIDNLEEGSRRHWENLPIPDDVETYCPDTIREFLEKIPNTEEYKGKRKYYEEVLSKSKGDCKEENIRKEGWHYSPREEK